MDRMGRIKAYEKAWSSVLRFRAEHAARTSLSRSRSLSNALPTVPCRSHGPFLH